jgi:hypothetical protein
MVIHQVQWQPVGKSGSRLSAAIQFAGQDGPPASLWYELEGVGAGDCSGHSDSFLVALLLVAMMRREEIEVRGGVCPRLLRNLQAYQQVFHAWFPEKFALVAITAEEFAGRPNAAAARGVGCAFSGGVDSSYTLQAHLPAHEPDPEWRVSHAVFVHGFDIRLCEEGIFAAAASRYRQRLAELGVRLITVRTNIREFVDVVSWELAHGSALASVALLLSPLLQRFCIPASFPYTESLPWGSHPLTDPLLSSAALEIIHDGAMARVDKIARVAAWPPARSWLRVCWERPDANRNCGRCYNCMLTMVSLEIAGFLADCPTFPGSLDRAGIRALRLPEEELPETQTIVARARAAGRHDLAADLEACLRGSRRRLAMGRASTGLRRIKRSLLGRK